MGASGPGLDANRLSNELKDHPSLLPGEFINDIGKTMAMGWKDPAYAKAFGSEFASTEGNKTLQSLGLPSAEDLFGEQLGTSARTRVPGTDVDINLTHGADAAGHQVAIIREGNDKQPGNNVTYVDNEGHSQTFQQIEQNGQTGVEVNTNGQKKWYGGGSLEVDPNTQEPIIVQGNKRITVDAQGNEHPAEGAPGAPGVPGGPAEPPHGPVPPQAPRPQGQLPPGVQIV